MNDAEDIRGAARPDQAEAPCRTPQARTARDSVATGLKWTLWVSVIGAFFGYCTNILLARVGPGTLGTYGLLAIYVSMTSSFLFFGGNAVVIRFIPLVEREKRGNLLLSYGAVVGLWISAWITCAMLWPELTALVFGDEVSPGFRVFILWVSPVYVVHSLVISSLKATLAIKWAQTLTRLVTVGSFLIYLCLYVAARPLFESNAAPIVWGVFLGLSFLTTLIGLRRMQRGGDFGFHRTRWFHLPPGFWGYTVPLQCSSFLGFLNARLDYLFLLHAGGLVLLGKYLAIMALPAVVPLLVSYIIDSLLPVLANDLAGPKGERAAERNTEVYVRLIFPVVLGAVCAILLFAGPLSALLGKQYGDILFPIRIATLFSAVVGLNWFAGTVLSADGKVHFDVPMKVARLAVFAALFFALWGRYGLLGVIVAQGISEVAYQLLSILVIRRKLGFRVPFSRTHVAFLAIMLSGAVFSFVAGGDLHWAAASVAWLASMSVFAVAAGYDVSEIRSLVRMVMPMSGAGPGPSRQGGAPRS